MILWIIQVIIQNFYKKNLDKLFYFLFNLIKVNKTYHQELIKLLESSINEEELIDEILKLYLKDEFLFGLHFIDSLYQANDKSLELIVTDMSPSLRNFF